MVCLEHYRARLELRLEQWIDRQILQHVQRGIVVTSLAVRILVEAFNLTQKVLVSLMIVRLNDHARESALPKKAYLGETAPELIRRQGASTI